MVSEEPAWKTAGWLGLGAEDWADHGLIRARLDAGAKPWRPMMAGWSPGRLSLAGPTPDLFDARPAAAALTPAEHAAVQEAPRLLAAVGRPTGFQGTGGGGLACVGAITVAVAARRLRAVPFTDTGPGSIVDVAGEYDIQDTLPVVGATDVPGGCILTQPWGPTPYGTAVINRLSVNTTCYGLYANPKNGLQANISRDGLLEAWDLRPDSGARADADGREVLLAYLHQRSPIALACAYTGMHPTDARAITGPPDTWLRLPKGKN